MDVTLELGVATSNHAVITLELVGAKVFIVAAIVQLVAATLEFAGVTIEFVGAKVKQTDFF